MKPLSADYVSARPIAKGVARPQGLRHHRTSSVDSGSTLVPTSSFVPHPVFIYPPIDQSWDPASGLF
jgi:hypothetical protein